MDGSIEPYHNTTEGAEIFFRCNSMFVPPARMTATCACNGMWTPDPASLTCTCEYLLLLLGVGTKPGVWTPDWTMDWTMDWIMDSILGSIGQ